MVDADGTVNAPILIEPGRGASSTMAVLTDGNIVVAWPDALSGEMVGQAVRPRLHLGVGAPFVPGDQIVALTERVCRRLEQVCEVELH